MAPFFGQIHSLESAGGSYRVDRPAGVDALRVIGNINARASSNLVKTMECTVAVFTALRRRGLISLFRPALPSPPLLRAWCVARLENDLPRGVALWNGPPGIATVFKSVMGWRAYSLGKRIIYIGYLGTCLCLPAGVAQRAVKVLSHAFEK
jgi:hypothetical protein